MLHRIPIAIGVVVGSLSLAGPAHAQHLYWSEAPRHKDATCIYGEITVLVTHPAIYYCGANWHPGEPAGGYCGIQHNEPKERRTIFSIWDTSPTLHPRTTLADPETIFNRFGGEGEGAHTHMLWDWQEGVTFQFFVQKKPGSSPDTTAAAYFIYDGKAKKWRHSATIECPNGDKNSERAVATLGGGALVSFLENFLGKEKDVPKVALYRLWLGTDIDHMKCLTEAAGDGKWGKLNDTFFLAEGDTDRLEATFEKLKGKYGAPEFGRESTKLAPITDRPLSDELMRQLKSLP